MADIPEIAPFDPTKKKKKKKKQVVIQHLVDDSPHSSAGREDMLPLIEGGGNVLLGLTNKENSVESSTFIEYTTDAAGDMRDSSEEDEEEDPLVEQSRYPWGGSERDYEYKELLQRVLSFLHEDNPQLAEDKRRSVLRAPLVLPEGTMKTVFVNFMDLCITQPEQVMNFMLTQLGTSGSLDEENRLVVRGRFAPQSSEVVLQIYINEYVLCNICRSPDTILSKQNHNFLLQCELCGSERYVTPIGVGYGTRECSKTVMYSEQL